MRKPLLLLTLSALALAGCRKEPENREDSLPKPEILMQVGDSSLTRADVLAQLPADISAADSARLFDAIVEEWLETGMVVDVAEKNLPDLDRIDRMVEQYRRRLLAEEYRRLMAGEYGAKVSPEAVKKEYEAHPEKYLLTAPVVKGIYVKLPADAPQVGEVRGWVAKATPEAIDELENYGLKGAMEYDYFGDQWVAWDDLTRRIPYRFGGVESLADGRLFETTKDGITYMLRILESVPAGEPMPAEFAAVRIEQELQEKQRGDYDRRLLKDIYARELRAGRIRPGTYVPLRYRETKEKTN